MVRNTNGGCRAKRLGRKFANTASSSSEVQKADGEFEKYACVIKIYGGTCQVITVDEEELLCTIRNKFKGRSKRNNLIAVGTPVLVGIHPWQRCDGKGKRKCDLLTVYDSFEFDKLLLLPDTHVDRLEKYTSLATADTNSDFVFSNEECDTEIRAQDMQDPPAQRAKEKRVALVKTNLKADADAGANADADTDTDAEAETEINIDDI